MEFFAEIAQLLGQKVVEASTKSLKEPEAQKAFVQRMNFLGEFLAILTLIISIVLPAYFFYSSFVAGQLQTEYFYFGIGLLLIACFSHLFTGTKIIHLFRLKNRQPNATETSTVEDELKYELGGELLLAIATIIPLLNLLALPLAVDRVLNIYEITSLNLKRQKTRNLAENIAGTAILVFFTSTLIFSLFLIIAGDTRKL